MIYFVGPEWPNLVKIGHADYMKSRMSDLQIACPLELRVYGVRDGDKGAEKGLHHRFRPLWHRGEWFRHEDPIREYIREHCRPWNRETEPVRASRLRFHTGDRCVVGCNPDFKARWAGLADRLGFSANNLGILACEAYSVIRAFDAPPLRHEITPGPTRARKASDGYGLIVRANREWVGWLASFARAEKMTVSALVRLAIEVFEKSTDNIVDSAHTAS